MFFKTFEYLKDIENLINESYNLPIFKGYKAINKRGVEKLIDEIYANLPTDVLEARKFLKEHNKNTEESRKTNIYDKLKDFEIEVNKSFLFSKFVIINVRQIENILDRIYENMPQEIVEAQKDKAP